MKITPEQIACVAHDINRAYCFALGERHPPWDVAPQWMKDNTMDGVCFHLANPNAGPEVSHNNWMKMKVAEGWQYGKEKDLEKKTHPCMVPFSDLPEAQRAKDFLFQQVVHSLSKLSV